VTGRWAGCLALGFFAPLGGPASLPALAAPVTYTVTPGPGQSVRFDARTQTERYAGKTDQISGTVRMDVERPTASPSARFEVKMSSLGTGNRTRDSNMRRRHLETERYPTATFTLDRLEAPPAPLEVGKPVPGVAHGTFTLHGVTRPISPAVTVTREKDRGGREALHIVARFVARLDDYKISTPRFLFFSVRQEHPVTVDVRAAAAP
jgi:polyisoprenoid-binding protein YceI